MDNLNNYLLDSVGKIIIENVRDRALNISMGIVNQTTPNQVDLKNYSVLSELETDEREKVCDLLSATITDTIYRFLELFEDYNDIIRLNILYNNKEYDMTKISEKMGSEIASYEDDGWIQRFSKVGRFIL